MATTKTTKLFPIVTDALKLARRLEKAKGPRTAKMIRSELAGVLSVMNSKALDQAYAEAARRGVSL